MAARTAASKPLAYNVYRLGMAPRCPCDGDRKSAPIALKSDLGRQSEALLSASWPRHGAFCPAVVAGLKARAVYGLKPSRGVAPFLRNAVNYTRIGRRSGAHLILQQVDMG